MPFARYSVVVPKPGQEDRVRDLVDRLIALHRTRDGFIGAYRLDPDQHATDTLVGRFSLWESEAHANATAMQEENVAIMAELRSAVDEESHEERTFEAVLIPPTR
jgi:heme-degrading monooxygenase HmoA